MKKVDRVYGRGLCRESGPQILETRQDAENPKYPNSI